MDDLESRLSLEDLAKLPNIAEKLSDADRAKIGGWVWNDWNADRISRQEWESRMEFAFALALQLAEQKAFPWPGASNVKFPLVTIAAMQYQARAYPALIPGPEIVKCRTFGTPATPEEREQLSDQALRIAQHMSYQVLEEDEDWESEMDAALLSQAIVGCAFKKTYFSPSRGHNESEHVFAKDLYISYYAKSLKYAPRITQVLYFSRNDMEERRRTGLFLEWDGVTGDSSQGTPHTPPTVSASDTLDTARDNRQGVQPPPVDSSTPYKVLEQHRWLDLDGDGFQEPYVCYLREDNRRLLRIVARWQPSAVKKNSAGEVYQIDADDYFTKYTFVPSPDGGIYDLGFGALLGPLNESINSSINLMIDSGTVANTAGGFLGRGVKFKSGDNSFRPWEWKRVDSTGDDLRKGVFPLPVREPSNVILQLLSVLIDYGERIGMATDPQVGVPTGQNTPAETSRNMIAEGQRVFNSIFKRTYRSLKDEFRKLYRLNRVFLQEQNNFINMSLQQSAKVFRADYSLDERVVIPAADPNMTSDAQKMQRAAMVKAAAASAPGYDSYQVEKMYLSALSVLDIEAVLPNPTGPRAIKPGPSEKVIIASMKAQTDKLKIQLTVQLKMAELLQEADKTRAEVLKLEAEALVLTAQTDAHRDGQRIAAINSMIGLAKVKMEGSLKAATLLKDVYQSLGEEKNGQSGRMADVEAIASDTGVPGLFAPAEGESQGGMGAGGLEGGQGAE